MQPVVLNYLVFCHQTFRTGTKKPPLKRESPRFGELISGYVGGAFGRSYFGIVQLLTKPSSAVLYSKSLSS